MRIRPGNGGHTILLLIWVCLLLLPAPGRRVLTAAAQSDALAIHLEWPNEGETFYAGPTSLLYSIPVKGWVDASHLDPSSITVRLEVLQGGVQAGELNGRLQPDGTFEFYVTVNPDGSDGQFPAEHQACGESCHLPGNLDLPAGAVTLHVTAVTTPDGQQAEVERHVTVDRSAYVLVPVTVHLADVPERPVAGVKVSGSTWLYMWRSRHFSAASDEQGQALIRAEALAAAATEYVFRVEPTVVNGMLYEGVTTAALTLPPGATAVSSPLTLTVKEHTGQVTGTLAGTWPAEPLPVWAIRLPGGESYRTVTDQGAFSFSSLPIDRYLLAMDGAALLPKGLRSHSQMVDLFTDYQAVVEFPLAETTGLVLNGRIQDEAAAPLPFAWITPEQVGGTTAVLPDSGTYTLPELPRKAVTLLASAPGYYSRAQRVDLSSGAIPDVNMTLTQQPGTRNVPWGDGAIVVPAESQADITGTTLTLEQGWLWGRGDGVQHVVIHTPTADISLSAGEFALEYLPGKRAWLYVVNGRAQVRQQGSAATITLQSGQMVNLFNDAGLQVVTLDPVVVSALSADQSSPLTLTWEPTPGARIRDQLARVGVSTAQIVTFITYFLVLSSLVIIPLLALYWWRKGNKHLAKS